MAKSTAASVESAAQQLVQFLRRHAGSTTFLTGAGFSTASGIPDYRGAHGVYTRQPHYRPMLYQEFMRSIAARQRYWARSFFGYLPMRVAQPNAGHHALTRLQRHGWLAMAGITQNVDGLHQAAATHGVVELHGALREVACTACGQVTTRDRMHRWLESLNPEWAAVQRQLLRDTAKLSSAELNDRWRMTPDGDVEVAAVLGVQPDSSDSSQHPSTRLLLHSEFHFPDCTRCGGIYKPHVVFFGENVARPVWNAADAAIRNSDALLVMGSSMAVGSAMRVLRQTQPRPIAILNQGTTRGDKYARLLLEANCADVLTLVADALAPLPATTAVATSTHAAE